jgi:hypothetical protein
MALQGTLKDFGIADIFQLIGVQQKNGILKLKDKEKAVNVSFVKGRIVGAESTLREKKAHLGEMLVRASIITKDDLRKALTKQKETLQKIGDILLSFGMITNEDLGEMIQLQITETIYKLFKWTSGDYEFVQQNVEYEKKYVKPISAESILMDGFRMLDEWPKVKRVIKSYDMVFQKTFGAEGKVIFSDDAEEEDSDVDIAFAILDEGKKPKKEKTSQKKLDKNERRVFSFVDGRRSVQDIINISRIGEFETCKVLSTLADDGLLEVVSHEKKGIIDTSRYAIYETLYNIVFLFLFIFIFFLLSTTTRFTDITSISSSYFFEIKKYDVLKDIQSLRKIDKIEKTLYIYYLRNHDFPNNLDSLVHENLIDDQSIIDPWGIKYFYKVDKDTFIIKKAEDKIATSK